MPKHKDEVAITVANEQQAEADAERNALKQSQEDRQRDQDIARYGGQLVQLPGGKRVVASEFMQHKYSGIQDKEVEFLGDPAKFLLKPDADYEYWLPDGKDVNTLAKIEAEIYMPVKKEELDPKKMAPTHAGTDGFVKWNRHILVKVRKDYADAMHRAPEIQAIRNLLAQQESLKDRAERETHGTGTATTQRQESTAKMRL